MVAEESHRRNFKAILPKNPIFVAKLIRREYRRFRTLNRYHRRSLDGVPILFANSFPKSGTHLLTQVLQGFTQLGPAVDSGLPAIVTYEGSSGIQRDLQAILIDLKRLCPGDIAYGHLHAHPQIIQQITNNHFVSYFIVRDPRDVAISHVFYVTEGQVSHIHHRYYTQVLPNFDERLKISILGLPDLEIPFPDIGQRFEPFMSWLDQETVLTLRYEDFMHKPNNTLSRVFDHAIAGGFPTTYERENALQILSKNIHPERSPTYRSGKTGEWHKYFKSDHKKLFKEVAGELLIRLGYEKDDNW